MERCLLPAALVSTGAVGNASSELCCTVQLLLAMPACCRARRWICHIQKFMDMCHKQTGILHVDRCLKSGALPQTMQANCVAQHAW